MWPANPVIFPGWPFRKSLCTLALEAYVKTFSGWVHSSLPSGDNLSLLITVDPSGISSPSPRWWISTLCSAGSTLLCPTWVLCIALCNLSLYLHGLVVSWLDGMPVHFFSIASLWNSVLQLTDTSLSLSEFWSPQLRGMVRLCLGSIPLLPGLECDIQQGIRV